MESHIPTGVLTEGEDGDALMHLCGPRKVPCPLGNSGLDIPNGLCCSSRAGVVTPQAQGHTGKQVGLNPGLVSSWPHPGLPRQPLHFLGRILNSRNALPGIRRVVNAFLAGIDSSKPCVKEGPGSRGSFQRDNWAGRGHLA